jgi:glycosyltransferase involved in cell wall biosynthesis
MSAVLAGGQAAGAVIRRNRALRVVHVIATAHVGGVERLVIDLMEVQKRDLGLAAGVLFNFGAIGDFAEIFRAIGAPIHSAQLRSGYDLSPWKCRAVARIFRAYDVVHVHAFHPVIMLATILARRPVVYTEHGLFGFGRKWRLGDAVNPRLLRLYLNRRVEFVTFNSRFTQRVAEQRYGLKNVLKGVVYNGVAFREQVDDGGLGIDAQTERSVAGKFVVGTSSRLAGFKRVDRLIDAFAGFAHDKDVILLLVGDGQLRQELERQAERLGVAGKVRFTGFRTNVTAYQEAMSVCVFPSQNEPFGLAVVEALSLGKPVLVFRDSGGIVEIVGDLCPSDVVEDVDQLASRLDFYYRNPDQLRAGRDERMQRARRFDIRATAAGFYGIYSRLAARSSGASG